MGTSSKRPGGQFILGFVFAAPGLVLLISGNTAVGCAMLGVGLGFVIGGLIAARKAAPAGDGAVTPPPAEVGGDRS